MLVGVQFALLALSGLVHGPSRRLLFASLQPSGGGECVDTDDKCAAWAASGECENNPAYMLRSCVNSCTRCAEGPEGVGKPREMADRIRRRESWCKDLDSDCRERAEAGACHNGTDAPLRCPSSCRICGYPKLAEEAFKCDTSRLFSSTWDERRCAEKRGRCARPPNTPPAVEPGGITTTMRRILSDFPQYSPRAISSPGSRHGEHAPWVIRLQNFVSDAEADAFIEGCSRHFDRSLAGDQLSPVRTSSQCWCSNNACASDPLTRAVSARIANLTNVPAERYFEPFQILKYLPGQFYRVHHDQNSGLFTPQGARLYTFFMYLSTPEAGGGTRFANLEETVPAIKGDAVLWPSVTDADPDADEPMTHHEGLPPDRGVKYAANVWVHTHDYRTPAARGCPMCFKNTHG